MRGGAKLLPGVTLDFTLRHSEKTPIATASAASRAAARWRPPSTTCPRSTHRVLLAGANLRWEMLDGRLTHEVRANHNGTITADTDRSPFLGDSKNISEARQARLSRHLPLDTPGLCGQALRSPAASRRRTSASRPKGTFADGLERERGRIAYTGEWRGGFADRLFLTAGIRHDDNDNFQDFTTWRTAASLVLREINMRPHASVGTAVKLPTMFEQFGTGPFFVPNPNLTPEQSFGWDAGVEFSLARGARRCSTSPTSAPT